MKKIFLYMFLMVLILSIISSFSLIGCKTKVAETTKAAKTKFNIGYQIYYSGNDWSLQMAEEFKYAIQHDYADMIDNLYYVDDQLDATKQLNNFDDLVAKGCDIIFVSPLDPNAMNAKVKEAVAAGIIVIGFAIEVKGDYTSVVATSDYGRAKASALWIAKDSGVKGKVLLINGGAGTQTAIDYKNGVVDAFKDYPDIKLLPETFSQWDWAIAKKITQDTLTANPDLAAIITDNDPRYSAQVFIESGKPLIPITWHANNGALGVWKELKEKSGLKAFAVQKPVTVSKAALDIGMKALKGEKVPIHVDWPFFTLTEDKIDEYYRPDLPENLWFPTFLPDDVIHKLYSK
ncbi:MAG: substrate-binding domain-containing protein [Actinobacteria bacterium]|nr:substrate-binding domain-containing protein [Actinomycetota bacterium]